MELTVEQHRARQKVFSDQGFRIAYVDEGAPGLPVLVLLHGMPTSSWVYRRVIPTLVEAGFRVVAPDLLGFGASDKPQDEAAYQFAQQADRLVRLMDHLNVERWSQVAHDLGGPWTWELLDRHPGRLEGLVVMNTTAYRRGFRPPAMMKVVGGPLGSLVAGLLRSRLFGPSQVKSLFHQLMKYPKNLTAEALRGYWLPLHEGGTAAFLAFARGFGWWYDQFERYQAALRRSKVRACTLWGRDDKVLDVDQLPAQFGADLNILSRDQRVLDASHFVQEDQPEELARQLIAFFQKSKQIGA